MIELSEEQRAIVEHVRRNQGNLVVDALAGSGKTTVLLEALKGSQQRSILICAFNKRIKDDIALRLPQLPKGYAVHVKTFHGIGLDIIKKHYPSVVVNPDATEALVNKTAIKMSFKARRCAVKLLRLVKEIRVPVQVADPATHRFALHADLSLEYLEELGWEYEVWSPKMDEEERDAAIEATQRAYAIGLDLRREIDFCDMIWAPLVLQLEPRSRYQAIYVDELQDISEPQWALLKRLMLPPLKGSSSKTSTRLVGIGDIFQQIYDWRGSMGASIWREIAEDFTGQTLPLTITWRCSQAVVKLAQQIVHQLRARPDADEGSVLDIKFEDLPNMLVGGPSENIHTFVLSRTNRDLLDCALKLWREGVAFELNAGRDMLSPLFDLLEVIFSRAPQAKSNVRLFEDTVRLWYQKEMERATKANATSRAQTVEEHFGMLTRAIKYVKRPDEIPRLLKAILEPGQSGVLLSSVHKVKGLEADRVFLLKQTFARQAAGDIGMRIKFPDGRVLAVIAQEDMPAYQHIKQEELNLEYVAITRAREHVIWVDMTMSDPNAKRLECIVIADKPSAFADAKLDEALTWFEREMGRRETAEDDADARRLAGYAETLRNELRKRSK